MSVIIVLLGLGVIMAVGALAAYVWAVRDGQMDDLQGPAERLSIPVSLSKSYVIYAGVQDALVQWWYAHNAVGFLLTTPILGLM